MTYNLEGIAYHYKVKLGQCNDTAVYFLCVFHAEKTPSMRIWRRPRSGNQRYLCFGCGAAGTVQGLLKVLDKSDTPPPPSFFGRGPPPGQLPLLEVPNDL